MSKINFIILDGRGEVDSYLDTASEELELAFPKSTEGYLQIGELTKKLSGGRCIFRTANLPDGELCAALILPEGRINLPALMKSGARVTPISPSEEYVRALSVRELKLAERVRGLESAVSRLEKKINGTTIF